MILGRYTKTWKVIFFCRVQLLLVITYPEFWTVELFVQIVESLEIERVLSNLNVWQSCCLGV